MTNVLLLGRYTTLIPVPGEAKLDKNGKKKKPPQKQEAFTKQSAAIKRYLVFVLKTFYPLQWLHEQTASLKTKFMNHQKENNVNDILKYYKENEFNILELIPEKLKPFQKNETIRRIEKFNEKVASTTPTKSFGITPLEEKAVDSVDFPPLKKRTSSDSEDEEMEEDEDEEMEEIEEIEEEPETPELQDFTNQSSNSAIFEKEQETRSCTFQTKKKNPTFFDPGDSLLAKIIRLDFY